MNIPYCDLQLLMRNLKGFFKHAICRAIALTLFSSFDRNVNFLSRGIDFIAKCPENGSNLPGTKARKEKCQRMAKYDGKINKLMLK